MGTGFFSTCFFANFLVNSGQIFEKPVIVLNFYSQDEIVPIEVKIEPHLVTKL